jgi:hypothetical protein
MVLTFEASLAVGVSGPEPHINIYVYIQREGERGFTTPFQLIGVYDF